MTTPLMMTAIWLWSNLCWYGKLELGHLYEQCILDQAEPLSGAHRKKEALMQSAKSSHKITDFFAPASTFSDSTETLVEEHNESTSVVESPT
jgi:hypothetical protein